MTKELYISSSPHETKVAVLEDDQLVEVFFERDSGQGLVGNIYKGRVSRVLPGMQSAFVDVGLDRDAFLYVSDFFEDSEEYDKVVSEAEAKVSRYSQAQGQGQSAVSTPAAAPQEGTVTSTPGITETAPVEAQAPLEPPETPVIAPSVTPVEPPAENLVATAPLAPPAGEHRDDASGHDHRGRRRRRRGRGFREESFSSKPVRPERFDRPERSARLERPERPERPDRFDSHPVESSEPHDFEILPGESFAKYAQTGGTRSDSVPAGGATGDDASGTPPSESSPEAGTVASVEPGPDTAASFTVPPTPTEPALTVEPARASEAGPAELRVDAAPTETAAAAATSAGPGVPESVTSELAAAEEPERRVVVEETSVSVTEEDVLAAGEVEAREEELEEGTQPETEEDESEDAAVEAAPAGAQTRVAASEMGGGETTQPGERRYTLRDSQQSRPRFAPRRRRGGRRGPGGEPRRQEASRPGNNQPVQISELLREGQEILVQIAKEPLGTKGARITSHIALPGRYLVYMPTIHHIGVSRKISSEEERLRLRNIILENRGSLTGGFIVRTAGQGRPEEELKADLKFLSTLWSAIRAKAERTRGPALLHRDLDLVQRLLRDTLSPDFKTIRADSETEYERVLEFVSRCQPTLVGHVKLYDRETPLFEEFGVQAEIDKALKPKVWLKSGGFIVINQTEALVAIDVNTGKYVGKTNRLEDTIVKTNIDAVKEIVRQIRLRDLGGIIVIDFIDMDERRNRQKVVQALEEALRHDRAPTNILSINEFGLVALTRKRVKQSLERTLCEPCHYCTGAGWIKSVTTVCYEILEEARKMAQHIEGKSITLRVNPEVAQALKSRDSLLLSELEALTRKDVIIKSDAAVHQERFEIF